MPLGTSDVPHIPVPFPTRFQEGSAVARGVGVAKRRVPHRATARNGGRVVLATMLAESPDALQRQDYHALRSLCGTAPVMRRSGKRDEERSCVTRAHSAG